MKDDNVVAMPRTGAVKDALTEVLRAGAQRLLAEAIEVELDEFLASMAERRTQEGRAAVVRNGYLPPRVVLTGIGAVPIEMPKVRSRDDEAAVFRSALVPPYVRRSKSIDVVLPWLYLFGVSTNNMTAAIAALVGPQAANLSAPVVARLKQVWSQEYAAFRQRRWDQTRIVYLWVDGVYTGLRAEEQKLCALVVIGADAQGRKHLLALEDGVRESTQSWREVLRRLKKQGLTRPPLLAVGDGALGFWAALSSGIQNSPPVGIEISPPSDEGGGRWKSGEKLQMSKSAALRPSTSTRRLTCPRPRRARRSWWLARSDGKGFSD